MRSRRWEFVDYLELGFWVIVAVVFAHREIVDLDIGWHLAGGLTILREGQFPSADPFLLGAPYWWNYSWGFQLPLALVFKLFSWTGVRLLQVVAVVMLASAIFGLIHTVSAKKEFSWRLRYGRLAAFVMVLFLVFPVAYLRPQLLSLLFFVWLLLWAEKNELQLPRLCLLVVVWSNIHVYWVLVPIVFFAYRLWPAIIAGRFNGRDCLALVPICAAALVSPYGAENIVGVYRYLFDHGEAYRLVNEFQPLSWRQGVSFYVYVAALLAFLATWRASYQQRHIAQLFLFLLFAALAALRMKYLPLFGLCAGVYFSHYFSNHQRVTESVRLVAISRRAKMVIVFLVFVLFMVVVTKEQQEKIIGQDKQELLNIGELLIAEALANKMPISALTHFDNGGWVDLGLLLAKERRQAAVEARIFIDGRTLVAGAERLKEFYDLTRLNPGWQDIVRRWHFNYAVLPRGSALGQSLLKLANGESWRIIWASETWVVLRKSTHDFQE